MKKSILLILFIGVILTLSCKDVVVSYPIPLKLRAKILIEANGGSFDNSLLVSTDTLYQDLLKELNKTGLNWNDVDRIKLEGAAYTVYYPSVPDVMADGTCDVAYISGTFVPTLTIEDFNLTDNEGITKVDPLTSDGVDELNAVWDSFLKQIQSNPNTPPIVLVGVKASGSLDTPGQVEFTLVVEFTLTAVVNQKQRVLSII